MKHSFKITTILLISFLLFSFNFEGCMSRNQDKDSNEITIMAPLNGITEPSEDDDIKRKIESLTGEKIKFIWIPKQVYKEKSTMMMSSGEYPDILLVEDETSDIVKGVEKGGFYDITDYISSYENLQSCDKEILNNSSFNNRIYGIYRYSNPVNDVIIFRKDWIQELNLKIPETPEELKDVLRAFKEKGSFGMDIAGAEDDKFNSVLSEIGAWFGAPNKWRLENDQLIPDFMTEEYGDGLSYIKDLYNEDLINSKFYLSSSDDIISSFKNGKCGAVITSSANALKLKNQFDNADEKLAVIKGVKEKDKGKKLYGKGYSGMLMFPKKGVKTEDKLKRILSFLNKLNSKEGYIALSTKINEDDSDKLLSYAEINTNVNKESALENEESQVVNEFDKIREVNDEDKDIDITVPLKIEGNIQNCDKFNGKIAELNAKYVFGQITKDQYDEGIEQWMNDGGEKYINDVNNLYLKSKE